MVEHNVLMDAHAYTCALNVCAVSGNLSKGREVYKHFSHSGVASTSFIQAAILNMYLYCKSVGGAQQYWNTITELVILDDVGYGVILKVQLCSLQLLKYIPTYLFRLVA